MNKVSIILGLLSYVGVTYLHLLPCLKVLQVYFFVEWNVDMFQVNLSPDIVCGLFIIFWRSRMYWFSAEPANILEGPEIGMRVAEGQTANLTCEVYGSPKPLIVWLKGDEQLTGGRFTVMEDGNLQIAVCNCASIIIFNK